MKIIDVFNLPLHSIIHINSTIMNAITHPASADIYFVSLRLARDEKVKEFYNLKAIGMLHSHKHFPFDFLLV